MPPLDLVALVGGLDGHDTPPPRIARQTPLHAKIGDSKRFWIVDLAILSSGEIPSSVVRTHQITATLHLQTDHVQMWVQDGAAVDRSALARSANTFETHIYSTNHSYFGTEWTPGIDGDPRLVILNARFDGAAGYFMGINEYAREVTPYSNEHEMFTMNLNVLSPGTAEYDAVLAHEFQHMIHWHLDSNEDAWLNEGASELAEELNGFDWPQDAVRQFEAAPDLQLNTWSEGPSQVGAHYGASYLMLRYLTKRFGPEALRVLVQCPDNGIASFDAILAQQGSGITFDELFADWLVANALDTPSPGGGRYDHPGIDISIRARTQVLDYPYTYSGDVGQYATDYLELRPTTVGISPLRIVFTGSPEVKLVPNKARSGRFQWWSNRGDASHSYLERGFDLTGVSTATLSFDLWCDIEEEWDYGYVRASTDDGASWRFLIGDHMVDSNPTGNAIGVGYTGKSGIPSRNRNPEGADARWIREKLDLGPFCGQPVLLRFDYITDDMVNGPGLCLDNLAIEAIGFHDDVESGENGWYGEGFIRHDNRLPQHYIVQIVEFGDSVSVRQLPVHVNGWGQARIEDFGGQVEHALLIISAIAPVTTERANYRVRLEYLPQASD
jgi:hypothetical protein